MVDAGFDILVCQLAHIAERCSGVYGEEEHVACNGKVYRQRHVFESVYFFFRKKSDFHLVFLLAQSFHGVTAHPFIVESQLHHLTETLHVFQRTVLIAPLFFVFPHEALKVGKELLYKRLIDGFYGIVADLVSDAYEV